MNKKQSKRQRDIKTKLMAAICMLLVSSIMMVSTTYAWFTLSTAPEVTGINTAVGANGNLEMALLPKNGVDQGAANAYGVSSDAGDSIKDTELKNVTWGNLVDLSDTTIYGLNQIKLQPSQLNVDADTGVLGTSLLNTPTYGADGRVSELVANTFTSYYNNTEQKFVPNEDYGVRAVGTASGMTARQLDYRNARSTANTARAQAINLASQSLSNNGNSLAGIAVIHAMGNDDGKYTAEHVGYLRAIVDDLSAADGVVDQLNEAYLQYMLALAASAQSGTDDAAWTAVRGVVSAEDATVASAVAKLREVGVTPPAELTPALEKLAAITTAVTTADAKLDAMEATLATSPDATFTWNEIKAAMSPLANPDVMTINGFKVNEVKEKLGELLNGVTVAMPSGGGVYADIADQCGNYTTNIVISGIVYNGMNIDNVKAVMKTDSSVDPAYLISIAAAVENAKAPASGAADALPISDMYGYVIDLAFRTNAADSNLLLQVDPADRIYSDNTNEETMGHGSTMTFKSMSNDFSNEQVKNLMRSIRIVFFDPVSMRVIMNAKLDATNATLGADGLTAKMYLYEVTAGGTSIEYEVATDAQLNDTTVTLYTAAANADDEQEFTAVEATARANINSDSTGTYYVQKTVTTEAGENVKADNIIMALTQNTAHAVSCLVYLDGTTITNADVAATSAVSMSGTMNLQFASSAELVPMEYAALHQPSEGGEGATTYNVTATGTSDTVKFTGAATTDASEDYAFTITDANDAQITDKTVTYKVGADGTDTTLTPVNGIYTIPKASITGDITITIA